MIQIVVSNTIDGTKPQRGRRKLDRTKPINTITIIIIKESAQQNVG